MNDPISHVRSLTRLFLPCLACLVCVLACGSDSMTGSGIPEDLSVLFVGNSLTSANDLPGLLVALVDSSGLGSVNVSDLTKGNTGLQDHWVIPQTLDMIRSGDWDLLVLQQGPSATEGRPSLLQYSALFAGEAGLVGTEVALYMVWPSRARFGYFGEVFKSYLMAAERIDGLFFPSGEAWRVAWETDPDLALYGSDDFHPSTRGTYAAALVMFEQITGVSPLGLPSRLRTRGGVEYDIDPATALKLQEAAAEANRRHALRAPHWLN